MLSLRSQPKAGEHMTWKVSNPNSKISTPISDLGLEKAEFARSLETLKPIPEQALVKSVIGLPAHERASAFAGQDLTKPWKEALDDEIQPP